MSQIAIRHSDISVWKSRVLTYEWLNTSLANGMYYTPSSTVVY